MLSTISQLVFVLLPGRQPFNYYLCTNKPESVYQFAKINWLIIVIQLLSVATHIIINLKIDRFKEAQKKSIYIVSKSGYLKSLGILSMDKHAISDNAANAFNVVVMSTTSVISTLVNNMDPGKANHFPYYLLIYFYHFIIPFMITGSVSCVYYIRHPPLRNVIIREVRWILGINSKL
jgi:hypothetical protein